MSRGSILEGLTQVRLENSLISEGVSSSRKAQLKKAFTNLKGSVSKRVNMIKNKDEAEFLATLYRYSVGDTISKTHMKYEEWPLIKKELESKLNIKLKDLEDYSYEVGKANYFHN